MKITKQIHWDAKMIRTKAASKWRCKIEEINYKLCLKMALKGETLNNRYTRVLKELKEKHNYKPFSLKCTVCGNREIYRVGRFGDVLGWWLLEEKIWKSAPNAKKQINPIWEDGFEVYENQAKKDIRMQESRKREIEHCLLTIKIKEREGEVLKIKKWTGKNVNGNDLFFFVDEVQRTYIKPEIGKEYYIDHDVRKTTPIIQFS